LRKPQHDLEDGFGLRIRSISLGVLSFPKTEEMGKTDLRPFLTILGTRMRARLCLIADCERQAYLVFPEVV
jgi:hypothetical protein